MGPRTGLDVLRKVKVVCDHVGALSLQKWQCKGLLICVLRNALTEVGCLQPKHVATMLLYGVHLLTYVNMTADCHAVDYCNIQRAFHCVTSSKC